MSSNGMSLMQLWGRELSRVREAAGFSSQQRLAAELHVSSSLVAMWETGRRIPGDKELKTLEELCGTKGLLTRLLNDWAGRDVRPEWLGKWMKIEAEATSLLWYESTVIPGLLQTEEYARAVLRLGKPFPLDLDAQVSARMARQQIFNREDPPLFHAIIDESVIRHPAGSTKIMYDQLMHLVEMAERSEVIIQVIPFSAGDHAGFAGPFILASRGGTEIAYVDSALRGDVVEKPEDVAEMRRNWQLLSTKALNGKQSIEFITEVANLWKP